MAIIEFINGSNTSASALKRVLSYIFNEAKTNSSLTGGHNCDSKNAYNQFIITKKLHNKTTGRQYIHFTQSFAPYDRVTPETLKKMAEELVMHPAFKGYQVAYAVHTDKEHLHTHYVVNSVNAETGKKWRQSKEELQVLKDYSDSLCEKYGLIITQGNKGSHINRGEYRIKDKGTSWKYELFLAVKLAKWHSKSKEDFIIKLNQLGYQVHWNDERKYITFTNGEGKKCRNRKLYPPEYFTKEALLKAFEMNTQKAEENISQNTFEVLLSTLKLLQINDTTVKTKHYPLTTLEGDALKNKIAEMKKGKGYDWDKETGEEI